MTKIKRIRIKEVEENVRDYHVSVKLTRRGDQGQIWCSALYTRTEEARTTDKYWLPHTFDAADAAIVVEGVYRLCVWPFYIRVYKSGAFDWEEIDQQLIDNLKRTLFPGHENEVEVQFRAPRSKKSRHRIRVKTIDDETREYGVSVKLTKGANSRIHWYERYTFTAEDRAEHKFVTPETCDASNRLVDVHGVTHVLVNKYEFVIDKADIVDWDEIHGEIEEILREIYFPGVEHVAVDFIKPKAETKSA